MITVVIPLYNKESTIQETITTVLNQTFTDFELVIVDDGSSDNSVAVVKNTFDDSRIKMFTQVNQGVSIARNQGVFHSKYDLIAFLDADDLWEPYYLEYMMKSYKMFPDAGMYCCAGLVKNGDGKIYERKAQLINSPISIIDFFHNPHVFLHTSSTVVKKDKFFMAGAFPEGMIRNEDYALFFSVALISQVIYCNLLLSTYVGGVAGQATSLFTDKTLKSIVWRHNHVHQKWININRINTMYIVFTKYEVRHFIKTNILNKNLKYVDSFIDDLDKDLLSYFSVFELFLYKRRLLSNFGILYINLTKIKWRLRGFPRVNYSSQ